MKIRTDFVTNSSCACFISYGNDNKELARAFLKFVIETDKDEYVYEEDGNNYFQIDNDGMSARYPYDEAYCSYLDYYTYYPEDEDDDDGEPCPKGNECDVNLRDVLEHWGYSDDKKYIFDDGLKTNTYAVAVGSCTHRIFGKGSNYVETTDGELYKCEDINYVNVSLSYHQDVFDNLAYYSRKHLGENPEKGVERLEFNYPSLAKAILLDTQPKNIDEWEEKFEEFEISINNEDEFLGSFCICDRTYNGYITLHVHKNGYIEVSNKLWFRSECWDEESCNNCGRHYCWKYDYYYYEDSLELITLRQLFEETLYIYPKNVDTILEDGTVVPSSKFYKDVNGNIFELNSPEVKPIGHVEHIYDKRFYILYDKDNKIVDLFYEEDLQKFVEEKSLTIDDKKKNIYEQGKLVYTVKCTSINELIDNEPELGSSLECGSTD